MMVTQPTPPTRHAVGTGRLQVINQAVDFLAAAPDESLGKRIVFLEGKGTPIDVVRDAVVSYCVQVAGHAGRLAPHGLHDQRHGRRRPMQRGGRSLLATLVWNTGRTGALAVLAWLAYSHGVAVLLEQWATLSGADVRTAAAWHARSLRWLRDAGNRSRAVVSHILAWAFHQACAALERRKWISRRTAGRLRSMKWSVASVEQALLALGRRDREASDEDERHDGAADRVVDADAGDGDHDTLPRPIAAIKATLDTVADEMKAQFNVLGSLIMKMGDDTHSRADACIEAVDNVQEQCSAIQESGFSTTEDGLAVRAVAAASGDRTAMSGSSQPQPSVRSGQALGTEQEKDDEDDEGEVSADESQGHQHSYTAPHNGTPTARASDCTASLRSMHAANGGGRGATNIHEQFGIQSGSGHGGDALPVTPEVTAARANLMAFVEGGSAAALGSPPSGPSSESAHVPVPSGAGVVPAHSVGGAARAGGVYDVVVREPLPPMEATAPPKPWA